jgi:hypothetical protein
MIRIMGQRWLRIKMIAVAKPAVIKAYSATRTSDRPFGIFFEPRDILISEVKLMKIT